VEQNLIRIPKLEYLLIGVEIMYAVIETGGQQTKVKTGEIVKVQLMDLKPGDKIEFDKVLMISDSGKLEIGAPFLKSGKVAAEVVGHGREKKISVLKFRRRKHHMKQMGHRQWYTQVKITEVSA